MSPPISQSARGGSRALKPRRAASTVPVANGALTGGSGDWVARERVDEIQRRRMLGAMVEVAAERGVRNVSVALVVARSGVSRRTFYEIFEDCEDCFLAAFDDGVRQVAERVAPAFLAHADWVVAVRRALTALLDFFERDRRLARLLIVESLGAGSRALERRAAVMGVLVCVVERGAVSTDRGGAGVLGGVGPHSSLVAEGVVGGALSLLHARLAVGASGGLLELANPLMSMIVLPYRGSEAADRELGRTVSCAPRACEQAADADPLRALEMRLTYRTVRVLASVAANPGGSNRAIADGAGVSDQGQISKLLGRLQRLGLIENVMVEPARGEPNSWTLTEKGWRIQGALNAQTCSS